MERFGITLPLRNQYFIMRVGQNFSEKGGKMVTNPEACVLDWPITELGREQCLYWANSFLDTRQVVWPGWRKMNKLAILSSKQGWKEVSRQSRQSAFQAWKHIIMQKRVKGRKNADAAPPAIMKGNDKTPPQELHVFCSDFKVAKQTADVVSTTWTADGSVKRVHLAFTQLLRERNLGANIELGGFDYCNLEELQRIFALDAMDGSHKLGGIESCEQVLSRCMQLLRQIEYSLYEKQIVLVTHNSMAHIIQTVFSSVRPGKHATLPQLQPGELRELKFNVTAGEDGEEEQSQSEKRNLKLYLSVSQNIAQQRQAIISEAFPKIGDMCARRFVGFSYADLRLTVEDEHGLEADTVAGRLSTLDSCNIFVCLFDPNEEAPQGVSEAKITAMSRDEVAAAVAQVLSEGARKPKEQFSVLHGIMSEMIAVLKERESKLERDRQLALNPNALRRDLEQAASQRAESALKDLCRMLPGLEEVLELHSANVVFFDGPPKPDPAEVEAQRKRLARLKAKGHKLPPQDDGKSKPEPPLEQVVLDTFAELDDLTFKRKATGLLWLLSKQALYPDPDHLRAALAKIQKKVAAMDKADTKYAWVSRLRDASLLQVEVCHAAMSSVPVIPPRTTFVYAYQQPHEHHTHRKRSMAGVLSGGGGEGGLAPGLERQPSDASTRSDAWDGASRGGGTSRERKSSVRGGGTASSGEASGLQRLERVTESGEGTTRADGGAEGGAGEAGKDGRSKAQMGLEQGEDLMTALSQEGIAVSPYRQVSEVVEVLLEEMQVLLDEWFPEAEAPVSMVEEGEWHTEVAQDRADLYVPDARLSSIVEAHLQADARLMVELEVYDTKDSLLQGLVILGQAGSGKASLMAHAGLKHRRAHPDDLVMMHFSSGSFDAADPINLMHRLVFEMTGEEMAAVLGTASRDPTHAAMMFNRALESMHYKHQGRRNVVVLIDGAEAISDAETNMHLWLPHILPSTIRLVISCTDGTGATADSLKERGWPTIRIPTLPADARATICSAYLARIGRVLSRDQMAAAVGSPFTCSPLFLTALAQQSKLCYSQQLDQSPSPAPLIKELDRSRDIKELYDNMLAELEARFDTGYGYTGLVRLAMTGLWASRNGLQECELLEMLRREAWVPYERLSLFLAELEQRVILLRGRLTLFHPQFKQAIARRYLAKYFDSDVSELMVQAHARLAAYFDSLPDPFLRKVEEYPFQLVHCVSSSAEAREALEQYLLKIPVFRILATTRFHKDLCGYWKVVCYEPGSLAEVATKYMGSIQEYVAATGDKGSVPELCFAIGFLLEELQQFRTATRALVEAIRTSENLSLMHPHLLNALRPNLAAQLLELRPKVMLHLTFCLRQAGLYGQAQLVLQQCLAEVAANVLYDWVRPDAYIQAGELAFVRGNYAAAEKAYKSAAASMRANDTAAQARVLERMIELFRTTAMIKIGAGDHKAGKRLLDKEAEAAALAAKVWSRYAFLDPAAISRPPSALLSLIKTSRRPVSASHASLPCSLAYNPRIPNQPTSLTVSFTWARGIDAGDFFVLQLRQIRAGGNKALVIEGPNDRDFIVTWEEVPRTLSLRASTAQPSASPISITIPAVNGLRLPVKQGGLAVELQQHGTMQVTKARVLRERKATSEKSGRPTTSESFGTSASTGTGSRPGSRGTGLGGGSGIASPFSSRPGTGASLGIPEGQAVEGPDIAGEEDEGKGSHDSVRLLSRQGEVLGLQAVVMGMRHAQMEKDKDDYLAARHEAQMTEAAWHVRYAYDPHTLAEVIEKVDRLQTNEVDAAHVVYKWRMEDERKALYLQTDALLSKALGLQEWLFGEAHPAVTDTIMIMIKMLFARQEYKAAVPLLVKVWGIRTDPAGAERLPLGAEREKECSLFHLGVSLWLQEQFRAASILLEALFKHSERHIRDLDAVRSLLALCHLQGSISMDMRIGLAGQVLPLSMVCRPLVLSLANVTASDAQGREKALTPPTSMSVHAAVSQCLATNRQLMSLDISGCKVQHSGLAALVHGAGVNSTLQVLNLANNQIGVLGGQHLRRLLTLNKGITDLDLGSNALEDSGVRQVAEGLASGSSCHNSSLKRLVLYDNGLSAEAARTLSLALKVPGVSIINLNIARNGIQDVGIRHLMDVLYLGIPLVTLNVGDCQMGKNGVDKVAEGLLQSTSLATLILANHMSAADGSYPLGNKVDAASAKVLAEAVQQSFSLTHLDLTNNPLGKDGVAALAAVLKPANQVEAPGGAKEVVLDYLGVIKGWEEREASKTRGSRGALRCLKVGGSKLGEGGAEAVAKALARNPALVGLDLHRAGFGGTGVAHVAVALGSNPTLLQGGWTASSTLTYLNLQSCQAFAAGASHIGRMLANNRFLRRLDFSDNDIGGDGGAQIAAGLHKSESLLELVLAKNNLGDVGGGAIGKALAVNRRLRTLDISLNGIGDEGATTIARGIAQNLPLSKISLTTNSFSALGVWMLSVGAKAKPLASPAIHRRFCIEGLPSHDWTREELPRMLSEDELDRVLHLKAP